MLLTAAHLIRAKRVKETKDEYEVIENKVDKNNLKHFYWYEFKLMLKEYKELEDFDYDKILFPKYTNLYKHYDKLNILSKHEREIYYLHNENLMYPQSSFIFEMGILSSVSRFRNYQFNATPESVIELVEHLLDISDNKIELLDLFVGTSNLIPHIKKKNKENKYYGLDLNLKSVAALEIALLMDGIDFELEVDNVFSNKTIINNDKKFDYIFANLPFSIKDTSIDHQLENSILPIDLKTSFSYFFVDIILRKMAKGGKAIILTNSSLLSTRRDEKIRKFLIDNGLVEAIYSLPSQLYQNTGINTYLYLLSYNNHFVKMADFKEYYDKLSRNRNELKTKEIIRDFNNVVKEVEIKDIVKNDYNLLPDLYLMEDVILKDTIELGDIAEIITGWQITRKGLEDRFDENGETSIIQVVDIENYEINSKAKYNVEDEFIEKYKLIKGDIVLTAKSPKVDLAIINEDKNIIPAATLAIIRVKDGYDPYYLASFLESKVGKEVIKLYQTGNVIKNLTPNNIKKIPIPNLDLKTQIKIGTDFKSRIEKIIKLNKDLQITRQEIEENKYFNR